MAPALRPTGRFYAAFYRWSCSTVRAPHCSRSIRQSPPCSAPSRARYAYSTTRPLLHGNEAVSAPKAGREETDSTPDSQSLSTSADQKATLPGHVHMKTAMRSLMRHVPSTVTVITAFGEDGDSRRPLPVGSAISSLTTVTLDPPHVSFNIKTPSRTLDAIRDAGGRFRLHFLDNSLLAAKVAQNFTEGNSPETLLRREQMFRFAYPTLYHGGQPPKLVAPCVLASMTCQLEQEAPVADHIVAIASVDELEAKQHQSHALLYHQGMFKRYNGGTLYRNPKDKAVGRERKLDGLNGHAVYCSYPLFPGDAEKEDFISRAKNYVKQNEASFRTSPSTPGEIMLKNGWGIRSGTFGLNLPRLVGQHMAELSQGSDQDSNLSNASLTHRFSGQLSSTDIATVADHAKALIQHNPGALDGDYLKVLYTLDVCPGSTNLLAGDILEPLREAGLIGPFEPRSLELTDTPDLYYLERIEQQLSKFFKSIPYEQASLMEPNELQTAVGITAGRPHQLDIDYLKQILPRITAEAYPEAFSPPQVDLKGHLSPQEVRIAVARIVHALSVRGDHLYSSFISLSKAESLRRLGIHPMVTGADLDFLWEKMQYLRATAEDANAFIDAVNDTLEPLFDQGSFTEEEVYTRATDLLRSHTFSILSWSPRDKVAALGFRYGAAGVLQIDGKDVPMRLMTNHIFNKVLQARVKDGDIAAEEEAVVEAFLARRSRPKLEEEVGTAAQRGGFSRPSIWSWDPEGVHRRDGVKDEKNGGDAFPS